MDDLARRDDAARDVVEQTFEQVDALLVEKLGPIMKLLRSSEGTGRYTSLLGTISNIKFNLQLIERAAGFSVEGAASSAAPQREFHEQGEADQVAQVEHARGDERSTGRRPKSFRFDFALLELVHQRASLAFPVGLEEMHAVANHLAPGTQRNSLTAKLNRWKNEAQYLRWVSANDMAITDKGEAFRKKLLPLAKREGPMVDVIDAIEKAVGVRPNFD